MRAQNSSRAITMGLAFVGGLAAAILLGRAVGNQNYFQIMLIGGVLFASLIFSVIGDRYWYFIPLALLSGLPAVPLGGRTIELGEMAIMACGAVFAMRVALKKDKIIIFRMIHLPILLFMSWIMIVFIMNPIGLVFFGADVAGGRFYLKVLLGFVAFVVISSKTITENDARWLIGIIILGAFINLAYGIYSYKYGGGSPAVVASTGLETADYYSWHQVLSIPALAIAFLIFARFRPSDVFGFQRPLIALLYALAIGVALLSGKRMGVFAILLAPFVGIVVYRQWQYILLALVALAVALTIVITMHGSVFTLPLAVQRSISWLPAEWSPELQGMAGGSDDFRAQLRKFAIENIEKNPIIGRGFAVDVSETGSAISAAQYGGPIDIQVAAYALGRSWHNTWLGYAADFGIPLSLIQGLLFLFTIVVAYRASRALKHPSALQTISVFMLITFVRNVVASHTSGHTALDAYGYWWMYAVVCSIYADLPSKRNTAQPKNVSTEIQTAPQAIPAS